MVKACKFLYSI